MIKVAIVGAGNGGSSLLNIFQVNGEVKTVGITDTDKNAPGLTIARESGIFIAENIEDLYKQNPDIIINTTGKQELSRFLRESAPADTEVIEGKGAKFLWDLIERQGRSKKDLESLYQNGLLLSKAKNLSDVLDIILNRALELTETPAGSIALCERNEMAMVAQKGLGPNFLEDSRWKPRDKGLTSFILEANAPVEFQDTEKDPLLKGTKISQEGIRSILAFPLQLNGSVVGIIYLDDFKPREFTGRHKKLIQLFGAQAAQAIEKFRILDELYNTIHELDETTSYMKSVLDDSQDMIVTTGTDGKVVEFSKGGERILGYTRDEIIGKKAADLYVNKDERGRLSEILKRIGFMHNHETVLMRKDGTPVDISLTISQLKDRAGKIIGTVGISKDITVEKQLRKELEEKNLELSELNEQLEEKVLIRTKELEKANKELQRSNQLKARFISNMSHELRTPLYSITGFSEILLQRTFGEINEKQERHITNILASGRHLLQLINNILDLAKIEAGRIDLSYETFPVDAVLDEVLMVMQSLSGKKGIKIETDLAPEITAFRADKIKFKQVLYNLFSNAIKFTPEKGTVGIRTEKLINKNLDLPWALAGQELIKFTVWDTGIGIKPEDKERIFEEFEQVDSSMARSYEGTGLGLALTKKLVELHGGHISVESKYGAGTEFHVFMPMIKPEEIIEKAPYKVETTAYPWAKEEAPLVLVVEDDLPTSEILTIHLTRAGYKVAHAYDGAEAVTKAKELKPFVITLDIMLPKMDGWEVLQAFKSDPEISGIPVIIHSIVENRELAYTLGATDYLVKPVDKNILISKLGELSFASKKPNYPVTVLVLDTDQKTLDNLYSLLTQEGFLVHSALDMDEGIELASATKPNVIIASLSAKDKDLLFINKLKENPITRELPVFILTNSDLSVDDRVILSGQIERILRKDTISSKELVTHLRDMEILHPKRAGLIDYGTGLFNYRYLQIRLAQEISRAGRYKTHLTLIYLDVDHFGNYISAKGEYYGNLVLKKIAELLRKNIRGSDVLARYGGDAFAVVLPNTLLSAGISLAKRFNAIIRDYPFLYEEVQPKGRITVSIGVSSFSSQTPEELILQSEDALRTAIEKGGDSVEVHSDNEG